MTRIKLLALSAIAIAMILGSSLVIASQPADDGVQSSGPRIGGGSGHALKK